MQFDVRPDRQVHTVSSLTLALKDVIEAGFSRVSVEGEVISARRVSSGHLYFTLKDDGAQLPGVIWRSTLARSPFEPRDGMQVVATGDVQVYPPHGRYQLVVRTIVEAGLGTLLARLEELKRRLAAEGLFDPANKVELPFLPRRVGVVTAATGAAVRDIVATISARFPARVLLYPARVQGAGASVEIARGIAVLDAHPEVDVIIVGRGGGSLEDLWAFNEEPTVRAVAACRTPIVSAVGHEIDNVLTDLAADERALTPTAAAERVVHRIDDLRYTLDQHRSRIRDRIERRLADAHRGIELELRRLPDPRRLVAERQQSLDTTVLRLFGSGRALVGQARERRVSLAGRLRNLHPRARTRSARHDLAAIDHRMLRAARQQIAVQRERVTALRRTLTALSPTASLDRGYAIVRRADGTVLREAAAASEGESLDLLLSRGALGVKVERVEPRHGFEPEVESP